MIDGRAITQQSDWVTVAVVAVVVQASTQSAAGLFSFEADGSADHRPLGEYARSVAPSARLAAGSRKGTRCRRARPPIRPLPARRRGSWRRRRRAEPRSGDVRGDWMIDRGPIVGGAAEGARIGPGDERRAARLTGRSSVAVKIEAVPIDIFHSELAQTPGLLLERFNDSCAPRAQFLVSRVDLRRKYPVNSGFEWAVSSAKENREVVARDRTDIAAWI